MEIGLALIQVGGFVGLVVLVAAVLFVIFLVASAVRIVNEMPNAGSRWSLSTNPLIAS